MYLLWVEDEVDLLTVMTKRLRMDGVSVDALSNGLEAWAYLTTIEYDAILLDIMLPGMDGLTLLKKLRDSGKKTPVILLTAKGGVKDRVAGLDYGADDYLVKLFAYDELMARLRALYRRSAGDASNLLTAGNLSADLKTRDIRVGGRLIALSSREYDILLFLLRNKNITLTRGQIEDNVWNGNLEIESNIVDVYIRSLRKKLGDESGIIQTIRGVGYVLREGE